jgi:uncharacterized protein (DUF1778 family)
MPAARQKDHRTRDVTINLRANRRQRALIDRAAETLGRNRSDFMLEAACRAADAVLLDRRLFLLEGPIYSRFVAALDARPAERPKLRRLMRSQAPWEK